MLNSTFGNVNKVASEIINSEGMAGWTPWTYKGKTIFHSSAGSKNAGNSKGTAFWVRKEIDEDTYIRFVAHGKHTNTGVGNNNYTVSLRDGVKIVSTATLPRVSLDQSNVHYLTDE